MAISCSLTFLFDFIQNLFVGHWLLEGARCMAISCSLTFLSIHSKNLCIQNVLENHHEMLHH